MTICAPAWARGSQTPNIAPAGSCPTSMRPWSITSVGPNDSVPPASVIALAWASTSEPEKYVLQNATGGDPGGFGPIPATRLPRSSAWW